MGDHYGMAQDLVRFTCDPGSILAWDALPLTAPAAVRIGEGRIGGRRVALVISDFTVQGGSVGRQAAARIVQGVERATGEGLPLLVAPRSGGTRLQEGTAAFLTMIPVAGAIHAHKTAGLPFLAYLRSPTTGGTLVSWAAGAHLVAAEPGAFIGLLGPKVHTALGNVPPARGVQRSETLLAAGLIDAIVHPRALRPMVLRALRALDCGQGGSEVTELSAPRAARTAMPSVIRDAWQAITVSRAPGRPGIRELLDHGTRQVLYLAGTPDHHRHGMVLALAQFGATRTVVVGHNPHQRLDTTGFRLLERAQGLAANLGLPLVTLIDTGGTQLANEQESEAIAHAIARSMESLITHNGPTVSAILGQGAGAAAIALLPADRTVVAAHGWLSSLPPEAASMVLYGDTTRHKPLARAQHITATDLQTLGVADDIVDDGPAGHDPHTVAHRFAAAIEAQVAVASRISGAHRMQRRARKYRVMLPHGSAAAS